MTITQIATFQASSSPLPEALKTVFTDNDKDMNTWASSKPDLGFEGTWLFQQTEDPSVMIMTAKWKDKKAHEQWVASDVHAEVVPAILPHLAVEDGKPKAGVWYLEADVFKEASSEEGSGSEQVALLDSPVVSFTRHFVAADGKEAFEEKFNKVKGLLEDFAKPFAVRGAWRSDADDGPHDAEWVVVVGWPSVERHMEFANQGRFAKYRELMELITGFEVRHYVRISANGGP